MEMSERLTGNEEASRGYTLRRKRERGVRGKREGQRQFIIPGIEGLGGTRGGGGGQDG